MRVLGLILALILPAPLVAQEVAPIRLGSADAPHTVRLVFSVGCPHCVTLLDEIETPAIDAVLARKVRFELVDNAGVTLRSSDLAARQRAARASFALDCVAGFRQLAILSDLGHMQEIAETAVRPGVPDPQNWAELPADALKEGYDPEFMTSYLLGSTGTSLENCDRDAFVARAEARIAWIAEQAGVGLPAILIERDGWEEGPGRYH
ncbi:MAG: hypothetical protein AAFW69_11200, partial [Pseudomonadota bacterium]